MRRHLERELKLDADADFELPELAGEPLEPRVFTSTYYDTPGRRLLRAGLTLRRRVENGLSTWQLKVPRADGRLELEALGGPAGPPEEIARLLRGVVRTAKLAPLAELRTRRRGVRTADAEVTIDTVTVMENGRQHFVFHEVEAEAVNGGDPAVVLEALLDAGARESGGRPKLYRALAVPERGAAKKAAPAFEHVRRALLDQYDAILRADPGVRAGGDSEDLHDLRVAIRRLRAILRAARPLLNEEWANDLRARLGEVGRALGPARDADVLIERLRAEAADLPDDERAAFWRLLRRLETERKRARRTMLTLLDSEEYESLLDEVEDAASAPRFSGDDVALASIAAKEFDRLRKAARAMPRNPDDETLHALRIRAKRARYAAEMAAPVGGKASRRFVARAKGLQDVIGEHQDAVVAQARLRGLADDAEPLAAVAVGRLLEREQARRAGARAEYPSAWRKLARSGRRAWT